MKTKIIFFDNFHNIKFNKLIGIKEEGCIKYFRKLNNDLIEIIPYSKLNKFENLFSINEVNRLVFVIKEINDNNIQLIKDLYTNNTILIVGIIKLKNSIFKNNCEFLNDIFYFPQLLDDDDILDIDLFTFVIKNNLNSISNKPVYVLIGKDNEKSACGSIPIFILKRFHKLQTLNNFKLTIYTRFEMNIDEIAYIEDCLREYISDNSIFIINQIKNNQPRNNTYFLLTAK